MFIINKEEIITDLKLSYQSNGIAFNQHLLNYALTADCLAFVIGQLQEFKPLYVIYNGREKFVIDEERFCALENDLEDYIDGLSCGMPDDFSDWLDDHCPDLRDTIDLLLDVSISDSGLIDDLYNDMNDEAGGEVPWLYGTGNSREFDINLLSDLSDLLMKYCSELQEQLILGCESFD